MIALYIMSFSSKILVIIPARAGSKRIKGKNTNGKYDSLIPANKPDKKKPFSKCFPCL